MSGDPERTRELVERELLARDDAFSLEYLEILERGSRALCVGIAVCRPDNRLSYANTQMVDLVRAFGSVDAGWKAIHGRLGPAPRDRCFECAEPVRTGTQTVAVDSPDGSALWYRVTCAGHLHRGPSDSFGDVVLVTDVTAERQAEEDLRKAKEEAESAVRAKSRYLAVMSHEIRTPLNAVIGMADILLDTELSPDQHGFVTSIGAGAQSLLHVINGVLDLSKIDAGQMRLDTEPFDLHRLVESVGDILGTRAHAKGLELVCYVEPGLPRRVIGDPHRLHQVLMNLVGNAVKFTEHGEILLAAESADVGPGGTLGVHFAVTDTGIGIPETDRVRIFDTYIQAEAIRKGGGTGLGLSISKSLVKLMGGRISVESETGRGSTFHIEVPFPLPEGDADPGPDPAVGHGASVLVVDDNRTCRAALTWVLAAHGFESKEAGSLEGALELLARPGSRFDAVVLDLDMPRATGRSLLRRLRAVAKAGEVGLVVLTTTSGLAPREMRDLDVEACIKKPAPAGHLVRAVAAAAGRRAAATLPERTAVVGPRPKVPHRILVADDNAAGRTLAAVMLDRAGYDVDLAEDGLEAVQAARQFRYDLILMDVQMPVVDGFAAARRIRRAESDGAEPVPILAVTAHALDGVRDECVDSGMTGYVSKPITRRELLEAVEGALPRREPVLVLREDHAAQSRTVDSLSRLNWVEPLAAAGREEAAALLGHRRIAAMILGAPTLTRATAAWIEHLRGMKGCERLPVLVLAPGGVPEEAVDAAYDAVVVEPLSAQDLDRELRRHLFLAPADTSVSVTSDGPPDESSLVRVDPGISDLVSGYLEDVRHEVCEMGDRLDAGDVDAVRRWAHNLKGSGGSYGFPELTRLGSALETAARGRDLPRCRKLRSEIDGYLARVRLVHTDA